MTPDERDAWLAASHVDNATTGDRDAEHPCGGIRGRHSWTLDFDVSELTHCVDCGVTWADWSEATS